MAITPIIRSLSPLRYKAALSIIFAFLFSISTLTPAQASRGGTEVPKTSFTIGFTFNLGGMEQVCSGALLSPTIIATAAHCVVDEAGNKSKDYVFAAPGVALDAPINPAVKRASVLKIFLPTDFVLTPGNEKDDIAFIQTDLPLASKGFIRIATAAEVSAIADKAELVGYGYGAVYETNAPFSAFARKYPVQWKSATSASNTIEITSTNSTACSGDSGGPITTKLSSGEEVLVAAMSGAAAVQNQCGTAVSGVYKMRVTTVNPYLNLVDTALKASQVAPKTTTKKYKITCVKGKVKKYFTGTKPKCPVGYKQSAKVLIS